MSLLLCAIYLTLFVVLVHKWKFLHPSGIPRWWVHVAFALKLIAAAALYAVYTWVYPDRSTSDTFRYFDDAMLVYSSLADDPLNYVRLMTGWQADHPELQKYYEGFLTWHNSYTYGLINDNPTVVRVNAFIALFSFGSYAVHSIVMSFLSLIGLTGIYRFVKTWLQNSERLFYILLFGFPSILLWTSGVMKEPLLILGLGLSLYWIHKAVRGHWLSLIPAALAFLFCLFIKPYVVIVAIPGLLSYSLLKLRKWRYSFLLVVLVHALFLFGAMQAKFFNKAGDLIYILQKKQEDFYNVANDQNAGSTIELASVDDFQTWLLHAPENFVTTYLRPFPWEFKGLVQLIPVLENILVFVFILIAFYFIRIYRNRLGAEFYFSLSVVAGIAMLVGSTVPVLGAIVRYKLPGLIFLLVLVSPALMAFWRRIRPGKDVPPQDQESDKFP